MDITSRPYRDLRDMEAMRQFLMRAQAASEPRAYLHPGDVVWRVWDTLLTYDPCEVVHLWEQENGDLLGFALTYPAYTGFTLQVDPVYRGGPVEERMLAWVEMRMRALVQREGQGGAIDAWDIVEADTARIALLERYGYVRRPDAYHAATRPLDEPIQDVSLPEGFTIRSIAGVEDVAERIAHRPDLTPERYLAFMTSPGYDTDLDLVAVAPDGRFGAYCNCWLDPINGAGEFEPVGTRPEFRRLGLARAILAEGLRRMSARGVHTALVCYEGDNIPARRLYEAMGFRPTAEIYTYAKG
jgi:ribosomal protein S18 acetylase RimI-like enzyme